MQTPRTDQDVTDMADIAEVPGLGFLPVTAFVIHAEQPVVIDTGLHRRQGLRVVAERHD